MLRFDRKRAGFHESPGRHDFGFDERSRSEEHTSELQSPCNLVCRLLLEKKKKDILVRLPEHRYFIYQSALQYKKFKNWQSALPLRPSKDENLDIVGSLIFFFFLKERAPPEFNPFSLPGPFRI